MNQIIIIAAISENGIIGSKNDIPWRISEDFKRFKKLTLGHPCIMGDITYKSLPEKSKPLPGRENIVLSLDPTYKPLDVTLFSDFNKSIEYIKNKDKAFIIGGATIYKLGLGVANTLELTRIHKNYNGDIRFPDIDYSKWEKINTENHTGIDLVNNISVEFSYETYKRIFW
jgi:dihydrofolate reductase